MNEFEFNLAGSEVSELRVNEKEDEKFAQAVRLAVENGKIGSTILQRKLLIGYGRAARYLDKMEELGYVSEAMGHRPRKTLITMEQYEKALRDGELYFDPNEKSAYSQDENVKLADAVKCAVENGRVSSALLQRTLIISYAKASEYIDKMERLGYISPVDESFNRKLLIGVEEYNSLLASGALDD